VKRIKVLHIIKSLGRGGAEMLLLETLKLHDKNAFDFHYIYFLPWKDQMADSLRNEGSPVTCIFAKNNISLLLKYNKVISYIRKNQIDIIHAHLPWAGIVARLVGQKIGIPVIYTEHNKQERYHIATRLMNLATMNMLSCVIAVSTDVADSIIKYKKLGLKPKLQIVPNGVNTNLYAPDLYNPREVKSKLGIPLTAPVIGTVAVFRFQKRLDIWLEIAAEIHKQNEGVHFIIVGDGPLKHKLLQKTKALNLDSHVHFSGMQTEVRPYLATMDIFMISSIFEGLPVALLEAMASQCAVVSTNAGGIKEVIRNETDGLICSVDDPWKLKEFALELIENSAKRIALSRNARLRILSDFGIKKMVSEVEKIYQTFVIGQRNS
jgi:glycosyltransferase involved in cell wall biosynthesis